MRTPAALLLVLALGLGACGDGTADAVDAPEGSLVVATTVSPITSIVANVVGDRARIVGLVPEGTNSHTFEPPPSAARVLARADVVFANGLQLEEPTLSMAAAVADDAVIVRLGDRVIDPAEHIFDFSFPESGGKPNPHLWTDPSLAVGYARVVAATMIEIDPDATSTYEANLAAFEALVDDFDRALRSALDTVPVENRKLVTYHDAYGYWARNYGWEIIGAVQPSDFGSPTPKDVVALIEQIEAEGVPAIFGSEVFPSTVLEQIAAETGARLVAELRDDDLPGAPGDADHSWLGLMRFDYRTIVKALGGDPAALDALDVVDVVPDRAEYPQ